MKVSELTEATIRDSNYYVLMKLRSILPNNNVRVGFEWLKRLPAIDKEIRRELLRNKEQILRWAAYCLRRKHSTDVQDVIDAAAMLKIQNIVWPELDELIILRDQ